MIYYNPQGLNFNSNFFSCGQEFRSSVTWNNQVRPGTCTYYMPFTLGARIHDFDRNSAKPDQQGPETEPRYWGGVQLLNCSPPWAAPAHWLTILSGSVKNYSEASLFITPMIYHTCISNCEIFIQETSWLIVPWSRSSHESESDVGAVVPVPVLNTKVIRVILNWNVLISRVNSWFGQMCTGEGPVFVWMS